MRWFKDGIRQVRSDLIPRFLEKLHGHVVSHPRGGGPELAEVLVEEAWRNQVSDIHFEPRVSSTCIRFRINRVLHDVLDLNPGQARLVVNQFKTLAGLDPIIRFTPRDAHFERRFDGQFLDLRLAIAPGISGETMSVRLLDPQRLERRMESLGLGGEKREILEGWLERSSGMFLAAGPSGSGKTTTLYALLHELKFADRRIVSIEDPIEYRIDGITQIQVDEMHHLTFGEGVKAMMRLDPDFLMVGEMRDAASVHASVRASLSGRVVLSTIHARDGVGAIAALRNWGLGDPEIAESLTVVVAQRLVRCLCPQCRIRRKTAPSEIKWFQEAGVQAPSSVWTVGEKECSECDGTGYLGCTGIFELWKLDEEDYDLILHHADEHALRRHLAARGHRTLLDDGIEKASRGITSMGELRRTALLIHPGNHPDEEPAFSSKCFSE